MATTTITYNNEVLTTTLIALAKEATDQMHRKLSLLDALKRKFGEGKPVWEGGEPLVEPWIIDDHSDPTVLTTGYEPINLAVREVQVASSFNWFDCVIPIVISGHEERINSGPGAIASILDRRKRAAINGSYRRFVRQTFMGDVAGFGNLNTWNGVDYTTGFLEEDTVGSQTNLIGGLNRATYAALPGCQNQRYDGAASYNANGLAAQGDINVRIMAYHPDNAKPDAWFLSLAAMGNQKRALQAYERYVGGAEGQDPGVLYTVWDGVPQYVETYMPSAGTVTTADPISAYAASLDYMHPKWHPEGFFNVGEFMDCKPNSDVRAALINLMCQNIMTNAGSQGVIIDINNF
ncbi:MAG: hypothetical protein ABIL09_13785 [Gemmatimonadota bacterium]